MSDNARVVIGRVPGPLRSLLVLLLLLPRAAAADDLGWSLAVEAGSELDTNIHREETTAVDDTVTAPVMRGGARLRLDWRPAPRQRASVMAFGGAKLYGSNSGQDENVGIVSGDGRYDLVLPGRSAILGARLGYYDMLHYELGGGEPAVAPRHVATASGQAMLTIDGPDDHRLGLTTGYRTLRYKPNRAFDWRGDHYGVSYRVATWRGDPDADVDADSLDLILSYELERRRYLGAAFTNVCRPGDQPSPRCFRSLNLARTDIHHGSAAELVYTGDRIYSARYELDVIDSNSAGQSLVRQRLELGVTTALPLDLFLTARAALQLDIFLDSLLLARDVQAEDWTAIEDDRRNSVSIHVTRDLGPRWSMEARYAFFGNEFATQELTFRRHVFYLGAVYHLQRAR